MIIQIQFSALKNTMSDKSLKIRLPGLPGQPVITGRHIPRPGFTNHTPFNLILDLGGHYFKYDNGNNEPIYDANTGAELRDPVSGL